MPRTIPMMMTQLRSDSKMNPGLKFVSKSLAAAFFALVVLGPIEGVANETGVSKASAGPTIVKTRKITINRLKTTQRVKSVEGSVLVRNTYRITRTKIRNLRTKKTKTTKVSVLINSREVSKRRKRVLITIAVRKAVCISTSSPVTNKCKWRKVDI